MGALADRVIAAPGPSRGSAVAVVVAGAGITGLAAALGLAEAGPVT